MVQPILLDTCAALWIVAGEMPERASESLALARDSGVVTYVSPITAWEVGLLARKGRFRSHLSPQRWFAQLMKAPFTELAALSAEILLESSFLPGTLHNDPADRIIAATAREHGFAVMTRDQALLDYAAEGYLSAIAC